MTGRRVGRGIAIPGRVAAVDGEGALGYRFVLPEHLLRRFRGDRVDLWAIAEAPAGLIGRSVRVASASDVSGEHPDTVFSEAGVRVFSMDRGNTSLDLRKDADQQVRATA